MTVDAPKDHDDAADADATADAPQSSQDGEGAADAPQSRTWKYTKTACILLTALVMIGIGIVLLLQLLPKPKQETLLWYRKEWAYGTHFSHLSLQMFNDSHSSYVDLSPSFAMLQTEPRYNATVPDDARNAHAKAHLLTLCPCRSPEGRSSSLLITCGWHLLWTI